MMHQAHGVDLLDICAGGHIDQQTTSWLGERANALRTTISGAASQFFDQAKTMYAMISSNDAIQALRNLTAKSDNVWNSNVIHSLSTIEQLQTASPIMQRYVMAQPELRKMYLNSEVEGYADSYENLHGDRVGIQHYDYRRVMDGIVVVNEETASFNNFYELIPEGDKELTLYEKVDILRSWNTVNDALDVHEEDPTSAAGNMLG